jgi:hypothetical protein
VFLPVDDMRDNRSGVGDLLQQDGGTSQHGPVVVG